MKCADCGADLEIGDWPFCGRKGGHESIFKRWASPFDPVVIHKDASGNVRYPGRADAPAPKGFERVELRTVAEVRDFERSVGRREAARHDAAQVREELAFAQQVKHNRADLFQAMARMSNHGRDFARIAIEQNNRRGGRKPFDAGFRVEALS